MLASILRSFLLFTLIACGGESGNSEEFEREDDVPEPETVQKVFQGDIRAVNSNVVDDIEGQVIVRMVEEKFEVNAAVRNVPSSVHRQHIRLGKNCPTAEADTNADGHIDLIEAQAVSGDVYIPLDSDLNQVRDDNQQYPNGGFLRSYGYQEETTRQQLVTELGAESGLFFGDRVVLILGVDEDEELPATVAAPGGSSPQASLPIGCAELTQVLGPST